ncbi:MAG: hypothetical protein ACUZ8E_12480 [Candidatus Anammoxibacter sp.]
MPEKNGNKNMLKTVLVIATILSGYVGTYFTTSNSMKTEMALIKQKSDLEIGFLKHRISILEAASPEKLEARVVTMQEEIKVISDNFKIIKSLL